MKSEKTTLTRPRDLDGYLAMRLERLYESGDPLMKINQDFDAYDVDIPTRHRLILQSPYGEDTRIAGTILMFGAQLNDVRNQGND